jgi:hypothetical protein
MEAQYFNIVLLLILNTGAIPNTVHQSTKLGLTSGENLHEPSGNNALSQAQPVVQVITLPILQNNMAPTPFLMAAVLLLPWPTLPLSLLMTVKQWQP